MSECRRQVVEVPSTFFDIVPIGESNGLEVIVRWYSGIKRGADRKVCPVLLRKVPKRRNGTLLLDAAGQGVLGYRRKNALGDG